jgi:DNA-binding MarR family transcriptional regulator
MVQKQEHGQEIELGQLEGYIGFHLRVAQDLSFQTFSKRVRQKNLQPGWFAALMVLRQNPGITQVALGRAIQRDKSTVTPLVKKLLRQKLITRRTSLSDQRRVHLKLTQSGERALQGFMAHAERHEQILDDAVGPQKKQLLELLGTIADRLRSAK